MKFLKPHPPRCECPWCQQQSEPVSQSTITASLPPSLPNSSSVSGSSSSKSLAGLGAPPFKRNGESHPPLGVYNGGGSRESLDTNINTYTNTSSPSSLHYPIRNPNTIMQEPLWTPFQKTTTPTTLVNGSSTINAASPTASTLPPRPHQASRVGRLRNHPIDAFFPSQQQGFAPPKSSSHQRRPSQQSFSRQRSGSRYRSWSVSPEHRGCSNTNWRERPNTPTTTEQAASPFYETTSVLEALDKIPTSPATNSTSVSITPDQQKVHHPHHQESREQRNSKPFPPLPQPRSNQSSWNNNNTRQQQKTMANKMNSDYVLNSDVATSQKEKLIKQQKQQQRQCLTLSSSLLPADGGVDDSGFCLSDASSASVLTYSTADMIRVRRIPAATSNAQLPALTTTD